jgi:rhodanese-related sulfurtransferase
MINRDEALVIDLSPIGDFEKGHIAGSKSVQMSQFDPESKLLAPAKSRPVVVVCRSGVTAAGAAKRLKKAGFEHVYLLDGGVAAWRQADLPLVNQAVTVTALAGITGSASGGMSIALAAMADSFIANAQAAGIPMEVLHRVAAMASGGMDTLPHNGAVITVLAVTGLTHRQAYRDIFAVTLIKTAAVLVVIALYYLTGLV